MLTRLKKLEADNKNIKFAQLGAGSMGKGIFYQTTITPGIKCAAISDIKIERAIDSVENTKYEYRIVENRQELLDCLKNDIVAICEDGMLLAECELFDAFIDASNSIIDAASIDKKALENNMHLIMMNAEADLIYGPYFLKIANENGLVYTSSDGDQPGVIKRIVDEIELWGFKFIMAGNIKGFLDRYTNPTKIIPEADKRNLDYVMCTSYTDGTKVAIENALVANALNCEVLVPGMEGRKLKSVYEIFDHYNFQKYLDQDKKFVEYILGARPKGGVFVIGYCPNSYQQSMLDWFPSENKQGRFNLFYRPYHLCHIETMQTIAEAVLDNQALLKPDYGLITDVYSYAKTDLKKGDVLDGLGGYHCYGLLENSKNNTGIPICMAHDIKLTRDITKDEKINLSDGIIDYNRIDFKFYNESKMINSKRKSPYNNH